MFSRALSGEVHPFRLSSANSEFHPVVLEHSSVPEIDRHVVIVVCIWAAALNSVVLGVVVVLAVIAQHYISCFEREEDMPAAVHYSDPANDGNSEINRYPAPGPYMGQKV